MTNSNLLKIAITRSAKTKKSMANLLGISAMCFYQKLNGKTEFKASEISKMCEALHLNTDEMKNIFFADNVELKSTNAKIC